MIGAYTSAPGVEHIQLRPHAARARGASGSGFNVERNPSARVARRMRFNRMMVVTLAVLQRPGVMTFSRCARRHVVHDVARDPIAYVTFAGHRAKVRTLRFPARSCEM
jgi:hypothetical protein